MKAKPIQEATSMTRSKRCDTMSLRYFKNDKLIEKVFKKEKKLKKNIDKKRLSHFWINNIYYVWIR